MFAAQFIASYVARRIFLPLHNANFHLFYSFMYVGTSFFFLYFITKHVVHLNLKQVYINSKNIELSWVLVALAFPLLLMLLTSIFLNFRFTLNPNFTEEIFLILAVFIQGLSVGIVEELTYRGTILGYLNFAYNRTAALVISSSCFALIHLINLFNSTDPTNVFLQVFLAIAFGLTCSLITLYTECVWNAVLVHGIWDGFSFLLTFSKNPGLGYLFKISSQSLENSETISFYIPLIICLINVFIIIIVWPLYKRKYLKEKQ